MLPNMKLHISLGWESINLTKPGGLLKVKGQLKAQLSWDRGDVCALKKDQRAELFNWRGWGWGHIGHTYTHRSIHYILRHTHTHTYIQKRRGTQTDSLTHEHFFSPEVLNEQYFIDLQQMRQFRRRRGWGWITAVMFLLLNDTHSQPMFNTVLCHRSLI